MSGGYNMHQSVMTVMSLEKSNSSLLHHYTILTMQLSRRPPQGMNLHKLTPNVLLFRQGVVIRRHQVQIDSLVSRGLLCPPAHTGAPPPTHMAVGLG